MDVKDADAHGSATEAPLRLMILAGEVSGDLHARDLLRALRAAVHPRRVEAYGIGGDGLAAEGVELFAHTDQTGVIGFWEVAKRFRFFRGLLKTVERALEERRPDVVLGVDYPGFNLRIEAKAKAKGIAVAHYVCPQVWAWHKERIPKIAASLDLLVTLFPFEPELFVGTGLKAVFAGNPLVDQAGRARRAHDAWRKEHGGTWQLPWGSGRRVALFPGSRPNEVRRLLPDIVAAAVRVESEVGECSFLIPTPTDGVRELVEREMGRIAEKPSRVRVVRGGSREALLEAEAAVVKSGTSTLEAALLGCPEVVVYRISQVSYWILKRLVTGVKYIGLVNILAGRGVSRELIQGGLTPATLSGEVVRLLQDAEYREGQEAGMREVVELLGPEGASERAAAAVVEMLREKGVC